MPFSVYAFRGPRVPGTVALGEALPREVMHWQDGLLVPGCPASIQLRQNEITLFEKQHA